MKLNWEAQIQNMELDGNIETLNGIAREFKFFLVQIGSLSHYVTTDSLFSTRNVETVISFQFSEI